MLDRKIQKIVEFVSYEFQAETYLLLLFLILYLLMRYIIESKKVPTRYISLLPLLLGFTAAFLLQNLFQFSLSFNPQIFYTFILPPILFHICYHIKIPSLNQNFKAIAIVSTTSMFLRLILFFIVSYLYSQLYEYQITFKQLILIGSVFCLSNIGTVYSPFQKWRNGTWIQTLVQVSIFINIYCLAIYRGFFRQLVRLDQKTPYIFLRFVYEVTTSCIFYFFFSISIGIILGLLFKALFSKSSQSYYELPLAVLIICSTTIFCDLIALQGAICLSVFALMMNYKKPSLAKKNKYVITQLSKLFSQLAQSYVLIYLGSYSYEILSSQNCYQVLLNSLFAFIGIIAIEGLVNALLFILLRCTSLSLKPSYVLINWLSSIMKGSITLILSLQLNRFHYIFQWLTPITCIIYFFTFILGVVCIDPIMRKLNIIVQKQELHDEEEYQNIHSSGPI